MELDARILKKMAGTEIFREWGLDIEEQAIKDSLGDIVDKLAKAVIPLEIVMPPVPILILRPLISKSQLWYAI